MLVPAPWPGTLSSTQTFKQVVYLWLQGPGRGTKALSDALSLGRAQLTFQSSRTCEVLPVPVPVPVGLEPAETTWRELQSHMANREKSHHGNGQRPQIRTTPKSHGSTECWTGLGMWLTPLNTDCSPHFHSWDGHPAPSPREEG